MQSITTKIKLKEAALAALPEELRAHAASPDHTDPPLSRRIPPHSAPIPGFQNQQQTTTRPGRRIGTKR